MSKKKNTLRDLDEFLKQQAASLVTPDPIRNDNDDTSTKTDELENSASITPAFIVDSLTTLARHNPATFRNDFYDIILQTLEAQKSLTAEDKMLINTILFVKTGDNWKDAIRQYWKKHS